jgi:hypothetical protein
MLSLLEKTLLKGTAKIFKVLTQTLSLKVNPLKKMMTSSSVERAASSLEGE